MGISKKLIYYKNIDSQFPNDTKVTIESFNLISTNPPLIQFKSKNKINNKKYLHLLKYNSPKIPSHKLTHKTQKQTIVLSSEPQIHKSIFNKSTLKLNSIKKNLLKPSS